MIALPSVRRCVVHEADGTRCPNLIAAATIDVENDEDLCPDHREAMAEQRVRLAELAARGEQ